VQQSYEESLHLQCRKLTNFKKISFPIKKDELASQNKAWQTFVSGIRKRSLEAGSEDTFIRHFGSNESAGLMKPLAVMDGVFKLTARRVGVGRDKEGDGRLLYLAARIFITALKCTACVQ